MSTINVYDMHYNSAWTAQLNADVAAARSGAVAPQVPTPSPPSSPQPQARAQSSRPISVNAPASVPTLLPNPYLPQPAQPRPLSRSAPKENLNIERKAAADQRKPKARM